jgi:hypothetical protein
MHAVLTDCGIIGPEQEMQVMTGSSEFCPVKAADGSAADHGDLH